MTTSSETHSRSILFVLYLLLTSLVCGAMVMVIEVLGSRVIGPFFGASLFVWTSLITVTLVGLALGYTAGGFCSDRFDSPDVLYGVICLAGLAVLLIPPLKGPVLALTTGFGLRSGALVTSALLFGPSLFLLGCVSPYLVRIAAREMRSIGRTVGVFYAISTVGSFIGTVCTGFVLIAYFRVNQIFVFIGVCLIALSAVYFLFLKRRFAAALLFVLPLVVPGPPEVHSKVLPNGTTVTKIYDADSYYGSIKVLDYTAMGKGNRELLVDGSIQGAIDLVDGMPTYGYYYFLQYIPYSLNPGGKNCLVMGLGPGIIPMWYERKGITTDVVDISPDIFAVAEKYFGFHGSGERIVEDARYYLNRSKKNYDYIILDVFSGDTTPTHVLSLETLQIAARRLTPGGVVGVNFIGNLVDDPFMTASIVKTMKEVFATVEIYPVFDPEKGDRFGNVELIAYNGPPRPLDRQALAALPFHPTAQYARDVIGKRHELPAGAEGIVLTDNFNPVDIYDFRIKEEVRRGLLGWTDREMLL